LKRWKCLLIPVLIVMCFFSVERARAEEKMVTMKETGKYDEFGNPYHNAVYTATAKARTTNHAWRTVGFTIRKEQMGSMWYTENPLTYPDAGYGNFSLDEEENKEDEVRDGVAYTTFTVPYDYGEKKLSGQFKKAVVNQYNSVKVDSLEEWWEYKERKFNADPANAGKEFVRYMYLDGYFKQVWYHSLTDKEPYADSGNYHVASKINSIFNDYSAFKQRYDIAVVVPATEKFDLELEVNVKTKVKQDDGSYAYEVVKSNAYSQVFKKWGYHDKDVVIRSQSSDSDADAKIYKSLKKADFYDDVKALKNTPHDKFYVFKVNYQYKDSNGNWGSSLGTVRLEGNPEGTAAEQEAYEKSWSDLMPMMLKMQRYGMKVRG
jgi:hypothetical protein